MKNELICGDCLDVMAAMKTASVDLVIGSPPYAFKAKRYIEHQRPTVLPTREWIDWMSDVTVEAVRISRNVVVWVVNGCVRDGCYEPVVEGLIWSCYRKGLICERPVIWHKNSAPNRSGKWFSNNWEYCVAFRPAGSTFDFDWRSIATKPKYSSGGNFRQRASNGKRVKGSAYPKSKLALPGDVLRVTVGGGHMGSKLACENEAPFPEKIVEPFVKTCVPKNGIVLDPFCGSGTTVAVAIKNKLNYIGIDSRQSQIDLAARRILEVQQSEGA